MKAQLSGVLMQLQTMKSQEAMSRSMRGVTKCMISMNKNMDAKAITQIMSEFMTEQEKQKLTQEVMDEAIEEAMDDDEEEETVVNRVMDELGIELSEGMNATKVPNSGAVPMAQASQKPVEAKAAEEDDFEARLAALKR